MSGWIKLHRGINEHWIWSNPDYLKWWIDILLEVNHTKSKVVIKNKVYTCNRGEKLYSLDTWATRWKTNKSKVRRFLDLLQKDSMIVLKSETQTTRLTVCKYEDYQDLRHADETEMKRKRHAFDTHLTPIQERKEEKECKEVIYREFDHLKISIEEFDKLNKNYSKELIDNVLDKIQNYKENTKYKSLYITAQNWLKKEKTELPTNTPNQSNRKRFG